jgi:hypothetical protein
MNNNCYVSCSLILSFRHFLNLFLKNLLAACLILLYYSICMAWFMQLLSVDLLLQLNAKVYKTLHYVTLV